MRTKIICGWLVGHDSRGHVLLRNAELVYEGNTILFVGENFPGEVDPEIDAGETLGHSRLYRHACPFGPPRVAPADYGCRPSGLFWGAFLEISVTREGTRVGGDPRYVRPDDNSAAEDLALNARFTIAELLRNGITTFVEFGSQRKVQEALLQQIDELAPGPI
jgi:5-methylthioadenosine/S-adenosylhomocysteine deaminase